jgi:transposase-like protein
VAEPNLEKLKAEILKARRGGRGARYSEGLKARVLEHAARRRAEGVSLGVVVKELGLCRATFDFWRRGAERGERPGFRRVQVGEQVPLGEGRLFTVESESGLRVSGLSLAEVKALLGERR